MDIVTKVVIGVIVLLLLVLVVLGSALYLKEAGWWALWQEYTQSESGSGTSSTANLDTVNKTQATNDVIIPQPGPEDTKPAPRGFNVAMAGWIVIALSVMVALGAGIAFLLRAPGEK